MCPLTMMLTLGLVSLTPHVDARPQRNLILTYVDGEGSARYYIGGKDAVFAIFSSTGDLVDCGVGRLNGTVEVFDEAVSGRPKSAEYVVYDVRAIGRYCRRYLRKMLRVKDTDKSEKVQKMKKRIDFHMGYPGTQHCMTTKPPPGESGSKVTKQGRAANKCCKALHDCKTGIQASMLDFDLFNFYPWDVYGCDCTQKFKKCLQQVENEVADEVGQTYFDILNVKCLKLEQSRRCTKHNVWHTHCREYTVGKKATFASAGQYRDEKNSK